MNWFEAVQDAAKWAALALAQKGWVVNLGGPGDSSTPISVPQPARSEFLENRAQGDWAETLVAQAVRAAGLGATQYGATDDIQSDEDGFKEFFTLQVQEVRAQGKRPDLLIAQSCCVLPPSVSGLPAAERDTWVQRAFASVEVRSSRYKALRYIAVKRLRKERGDKNVGQMATNFTVKVEDLEIMYRWIELHRLPQAYVQVFFDSVFGLNVRYLLEVIASWPSDLKLVEPTKSQGKPTIFIPITYGEQIGEMVQPPTFAAGVKETPLGQLNAYVIPQGGELRLERERLMRILLGEVHDKAVER
jgi:hypothetical protein